MNAIDDILLLAFINSRRKKLKTQIKILKAYHGDCILIKTYNSKGEEFVILMDGGTANTFDFTLKKELKEITKIDLMILSHIDSDHIAGFIRFLKNSLFDKIEVKKYWINSPNLIRISKGNKISYNQGVELDELLLKKNELESKLSSTIRAEDEHNLSEGIKATILSPTQSEIDTLYSKYPLYSNRADNNNEVVNISNNATSQLGKGTLRFLADAPFVPSKKIEKDIFNSSSIALLLELCDCSILLLGDSRSEVVEKVMRKLGYSLDKQLDVDYVKVSHHGSKNNTSSSLLDIIKCNNFIISTNGGNGKSKHPDREVIARIIHHKKRDYSKKRTIYFNYPLSTIEERSGVIVQEEDFSEGNWDIKDNNMNLPL